MHAADLEAVLQPEALGFVRNVRELGTDGAAVDVPQLRDDLAPRVVRVSRADHHFQVGINLPQALDRLDALESRIRELVKLVQEFKKKNALLEDELKATRQRLSSQDDMNRQWEQERVDIKARIERVMGEIDLLECLDDSKEVALD